MPSQASQSQLDQPSGHGTDSRSLSLLVDVRAHANSGGGAVNAALHPVDSLKVLLRVPGRLSDRQDAHRAPSFGT